MPVRRALIGPHLLGPGLLGLTLLAGGCARGPDVSAPAHRFAVAMEQADETSEHFFNRLDGFERRVQREQMAIAFALNAPVASGAGSAVSTAAGEVVAPAIAALAAHAERLDYAATGDPADIEPGAESLDDAAAAGLERLRLAGVVVPEAERAAGIAGIAALARAPERGARRGNVVQLAAASDPQVRAVVALLRRVIGSEAAAGTRAMLRARRANLDAAEARFLDGVRRDRTLGPAQRYALVRDLAQAREGDPLDGSFDAILAVLATTEAAHAAIAAGAGAAEVAALEAAVARLEDYSGAPQRD